MRIVESLELVVVLLMVLVNAVFAAYEIALASVTVARLQLLVNEGRAGAVAALRMKDEIEKSLAVVQLGITLVGLIAGATGGASATEDIAPILQRAGLHPVVAEVLAITVIVLPLTAITIVVGELVPKLFALRNKEWVCLRLSRPMSWFALSVWPVVWLLEKSASQLMDLSERLWRPGAHGNVQAEAIELQELRAIASLARTSRLIGDREENIILGAARLASRPLQEILLPKEHIRLLTADARLNDSLAAAHLDMHTRFPVSVQPGDPQTIIGYVTFKDMVAAQKTHSPDQSLRSILRRIVELPDNLTLSAAMERLLRERSHIAITRNAAGVVSGMITLEDVMEELIGDIQDEYDLLPVHVVQLGTGWIVGGGVGLPRLRELTGLKFPPGNSAINLSAWITERLGRIPLGGDVVCADGIHARVRKVRRQRVLEATLSADPPVAEMVPAG